MVAEASGRWQVADGKVIGHVVITSALRVEDSLVTSVAPHGALDVAPATVRLSEADEVTGTG